MSHLSTQKQNIIFVLRCFPCCPVWWRWYLIIGGLRTRCDFLDETWQCHWHIAYADLDFDYWLRTPAAKLPRRLGRWQDIILLLTREYTWSLTFFLVLSSVIRQFLNYLSVLTREDTPCRKFTPDYRLQMPLPWISSLRLLHRAWWEHLKILEKESDSVYLVLISC